jgi:hypothetical protein
MERSTLTEGNTVLKAGAFQDCETVSALLGQMVGAASTCWDNLGGAGAFDTENAREVVVIGQARLVELAAR